MNKTSNKFGFSFLRLRNLWEYYFPIVKWQMIIYAVISACCAVLELLPTGTFLQFSLFTMIWMIIPFLFMLSPLVFARNGDARMVECQLPVNATEKFVSFALYLLIVIPLLVFVLPEFALWLYTKIPSLQNDLMMSLLNLRWKFAPGLAFLNILTSTSGVLTCLCVVLRAKSNRILKAVAAVFVVEFSVGLIGGIYGMYSAIRGNYSEVAPYDFNKAVDFRIHESVMGVGEAWGFQLAVAIIMVAYIIWIIRTIYKTLRRGDCCL